MRRRLLPLLLAVLLFAPAAEAHTVKPGAVARAAAAPVLDVLPIKADPAAVGIAERLAQEFRISQGWGDACAAGVEVVFISNVDQVAGAWVGAFVYTPGSSCRMYLRPEYAGSNAAFCQIYVHERLHLARNDGWHSLDVSNPLYSEGANSKPHAFQPCLDVYENLYFEERYQDVLRWQVTRREARSAVRRRLPSRRWHLRYSIFESTIVQDRPEVIQEWSVTARRKVRRHGRRHVVRRYFIVSRSERGRVAVRRGEW